MKINTALILCAGLGRRLDPLTLKTPKPLLEIKNITMLEKCIRLSIECGVQKILLNTFHLEDKIIKFIRNRKFPIDINVIKDGQKILNTGGGILNMIKNSEENDFIVFNPDTVWNKSYIPEIKKMCNFYFSNNLDNILLLTDRNKSFDTNLKGDFDLKKNLLEKKENNTFIYIGCQILSRSLFNNYQVSNFSISEIWNEQLKKKKLYGFESINNFYHLTNLEIFKKLKDF